MIDKIKESDSFEQFLGDGMYLMFDGTNISNTILNAKSFKKLISK